MRKALLMTQGTTNKQAKKKKKRPMLSLVCLRNPVRWNLLCVKQMC